MKPLNWPNMKASDVFKACISNIRDTSLKARLSACEPLISVAESEFHAKALAYQTHTIATEKSVNGNVTSTELRNVYDSKMAKKESPGRNIYNKIKASAPNNVCPLCNFRDVGTLDHYLPQAHFPRLVVTPLNLIPTCSSCNHALGDTVITEAEKTKLHPYYDDLGNEIWLKAEVIRSSPPSVQFYVECPSDWHESLCKRVDNYFEKLALNNLYSDQSAVILSNLQYRLNDLYAKSGQIGVKGYLTEEADTRFAYDPNSWQSALYQAISNDNWFCDGGFVIPL